MLGKRAGGSDRNRRRRDRGARRRLLRRALGAVTPRSILRDAVARFPTFTGSNLKGFQQQ